MKKFLCSADEYEDLRHSYNSNIQLRDKCLKRTPGTTPYEAHERFGKEAEFYAKALDAFEVREGSQRTPNGTLILSPQFQRDLEVFFAELRKEMGLDGLSVEEVMAREYPELTIEP